MPRSPARGRRRWSSGARFFPTNKPVSNWFHEPITKYEPTSSMQTGESATWRRCHRNMALGESSIVVLRRSNFCAADKMRWIFRPERSISVRDSVYVRLFEPCPKRDLPSDRPKVPGTPFKAFCVVFTTQGGAGSTPEDFRLEALVVWCGFMTRPHKLTNVMVSGIN